jgi:hypothetical protein
MANALAINENTKGGKGKSGASEQGSSKPPSVKVDQRSRLEKPEPDEKNKD